MPQLPVARLSILVAMAASSSAAASDRIAVVASGLDAQAQLEEVLCVSQTCVPADKVTSGGRVDGRKVDHENVTFTVVATRARRGLEVAVKDGAGRVRYAEEVEAGAGGKIAVGTLVSLAAKVIDSIENGPSKKLAAEAPKYDAKHRAKMAAWARAQKAKPAKKKLAMAKQNKRNSRG